MEEKAKLVFSRITGTPVERIDWDTSPDTLEVWDSAMHLSLMMAFEEEFCVKFTDTQIVEMLNFALILETLKELGAV